jgi:hypothetical protein
VPIDLLHLHGERVGEPLPSQYGTIFRIGFEEIAYIDGLASMNKEDAVKITASETEVHFSSEAANPFTHREGKVVMIGSGDGDGGEDIPAGSAILSPKAWNILAFAAKKLRPTLDDAVSPYCLIISLPSGDSPVKADFISSTGISLVVYLAQKVAQ